MALAAVKESPTVPVTSWKTSTTGCITLSTTSGSLPGRHRRLWPDVGLLVVTRAVIRTRSNYRTHRRLCDKTDRGFVKNKKIKKTYCLTSSVLQCYVLYWFGLKPLVQQKRRHVQQTRSFAFPHLFHEIYLKIRIDVMEIGVVSAVGVHFISDTFSSPPPVSLCFTDKKKKKKKSEWTCRLPPRPSEPPARLHPSPSA